MKTNKVEIQSNKDNVSLSVELDPKTANVVLNKVLEACDMEPNSIPIETYMKWGNYTKTSFSVAKKVTYIALIILILLPFMFFKPAITADRVDVKSASSAVYDVDLKSIIPIKTVSATMNGEPVDVQQTEGKHYRTKVKQNGTLEITAVAINGQIAKRQCSINQLDTQKPVFISSESRDGVLYITVEDTYSGVDYSKIEGMEPEYYNEKKGLIVFDIPAEATNVTIPDKAGNVLQLLIQPVT